jgi:hypothetical protein
MAAAQPSPACTRALAAGAATARVALLLLAAFLLALLLLLLGMLATATRAFQSAKGCEEAHVLRGYASTILDVEAAAPEARRGELGGGDGALGAFVHVLEPQPASRWLLGEMQQQQGGLPGRREAGGPAWGSAPGGAEGVRGELAALREQLDGVQRSVQQAVRQALQSQAQQLQAALLGAHEQQPRRRREQTPPKPSAQPGPQQAVHRAAQRAASPPPPQEQQPSRWLLERSESRRGSGTGGGASGMQRQGVSASADGLTLAQAGERDASKWLLRRSADG